MKTKKVEISVESLLFALEGNYGNPNFYEFTGKMRAVFSSSDKKYLTIEYPGKPFLKIIKEEIETL